jgi:hypothetical protein
MVTCVAIGLVAPILLAAGYAVAPGDGVIASPLEGGQGALVAAGALLIPVSVLVSSSVDWYLIRAFRDGVHGPPSCQAPPGESMAYAKYWILHRMTSEFLVYAGVLLLIATASAIAGEATRSDTGRDVLSLIGLTGAIGWTYSQLLSLKPALDFVRQTTCGLGEWVKGRNDQTDEIVGFVLDAAIDPGIQLIDHPRGYRARDISDPDWSVPLRTRRTIKPAEGSKVGCDATTCEFWLPDCEVGLRAREQG